MSALLTCLVPNGTPDPVYTSCDIDHIISKEV